MERVSFAYIEKVIDFTDKQSIYNFVEKQSQKNTRTCYMYIEEDRQHYTSHFEEKCIHELSGGEEWKYTITIVVPYRNYNMGW